MTHTTLKSIERERERERHGPIKEMGHPARPHGTMGSLSIVPRNPYDQSFFLTSVSIHFPPYLLASFPWLPLPTSQE